MQHFSYYAKAYAAALYAGLIYLMANIAPTASHLSDIPLIVWIGFAAAIFGSFGLTAVVTNGPKPSDAKQAQADAEAAKQTALAASAVDAPAPIKVAVPVPETSPVITDVPVPATPVA